MKTAVVVGAGPGLGNHIAQEFGSHGYQIILMARRKEKLDEYVEDLKAKGITAFSQPVDAGDSHSIKKAFEETRKQGFDIDTLIYNAADLKQKPVDQLDGKEMLNHFRIDVAGAMDCVNEVLPEMKQKKQGTILFTGGLLGVFPNASYHYACMSMDKAALRALAQMLNQSLENSGVYAGIVNVMGNVGSDTAMDPAKVAQAFWELAAYRNGFEKDYPAHD